MAVVKFDKSGRPAARRDVSGEGPAPLAALLRGASIEVMPRSAARIADFRAFLPRGTRVCIAHIDGTPIEDMVATARRLRNEGLDPMPHIPARLIRDRATLADWIDRYTGEAGVDQALILAGGTAKPRGVFSHSMAILETGLFDRAGFERLHVAGHPEGSRDIDPDGGEHQAMAALAWKQSWFERSDIRPAIVTQFTFEPAPALDWADRLRRAGIGLPIHLGVAGPAKLQTLIRYAISCGVGPSLRVLERRARDVSRLLRPYEPTDFLTDLAARISARPPTSPDTFSQVHFFPLGGIRATADWLLRHRGTEPVPEPQPTIKDTP